MTTPTAAATPTATTTTTATTTAAKAAAPTPAPAPADDTAARETAVAQSALERGRVGAAIEAGERAVALDAADGNAWLLLGAAYQQKGDMKNARRCYKSCVDQATRGPRRECSAMLR
jgi:Flp pilus assembly protein TadD